MPPQDNIEYDSDREMEEDSRGEAGSVNTIAPHDSQGKSGRAMRRAMHAAGAGQGQLDSPIWAGSCNRSDDGVFQVGAGGQEAETEGTFPGGGEDLTAMDKAEQDSCGKSLRLLDVRLRVYELDRVAMVMQTVAKNTRREAEDSARKLKHARRNLEVAKDVERCNKERLGRLVVEVENSQELRRRAARGCEDVASRVPPPTGESSLHAAGAGEITTSPLPAEAGKRKRYTISPAPLKAQRDCDGLSVGMAAEGSREDGGDGEESGPGVSMTVEKSPEEKTILAARRAVAAARRSARRMRLVEVRLTKTAAQLEAAAVEAENAADEADVTCARVKAEELEPAERAAAEAKAHLRRFEIAIDEETRKVMRAGPRDYNSLTARPRSWVKGAGPVGFPRFPAPTMSPQEACLEEMLEEEAAAAREAAAEKRRVATMKAQATRARNRAERERRQRLVREAREIAGDSGGGGGGSGSSSSDDGGRMGGGTGVDEVVRREGKRSVRPTAAQQEYMAQKHLRL